MHEYLVETYVSRANPATAETGTKSIRAAAEHLTSEGKPVRLLRSIFVPTEETCFYLFEAVSAAVVRLAGERAELSFDRVSEASAWTNATEAGR
jgi:hypothetical protein